MNPYRHASNISRYEPAPAIKVLKAGSFAKPPKKHKRRK